MIVHRAAERPVSHHDGGIESRHSFSFGAHYDPTNVGFGLLVCHNEDLLPAHAGYPDHPHRDLEIVTWVLEGELHHRDSSGHSGVVTPGVVQRLSAGSGVVHQEYAGPGTTRFVQMWLRPEHTGLAPSYDAAPVEAGAGWTPLVGGEATVGIHAEARLWLGTVRGRLTTAEGPYDRHLFVLEGSITANGHELHVGDALRTREAIDLAGEGEALLWQMA